MIDFPFDAEQAKAEPRVGTVGKSAIGEAEASLDGRSPPDELIIELVISRVVRHKPDRRDEAEQREDKTSATRVVTFERSSCGDCDRQ